MEHYDDYDTDLATFALFSALLPQLEPGMRGRVLALVQSAEAGNGNPPDAEDAISEAEIQEVLRTLDWEEWRPDVVELFLHRSHVLEVIPESQQSWLPMVHDSLLLFLNRLSKKRLLERLALQARLARDASRGKLLLAFVARTPSLQKLGQILARYPGVAGDLRLALQTLENGIATTSREEVVSAIEEELGDDVISRYQIRFADQVLAEASVGAVIRAKVVPSDTSGPQDAVCKLLKPYAITGLEEELRILENVIQNLQDNGDFYDIGEAPVVELFEELRGALAKEIQVTEEQSNLTMVRPDVNEMNLGPVEPKIESLGANVLRLKTVSEYLGVRKELVSPRVSGMLVRVDDAARRPTPHLPKQLTHPLRVREIELRIDHETAAGVDQPGARVPRSRPVGNTSVDVVADFF